MFQKVEINIPLLDSIKQIPKYAKFLKEFCVHKRKKMKGGVELGGIVLALIRNDDFAARVQQALPKKCRDPKIFSIPCTIGNCTFADAMLDLGASINVMSISINKSLNFGDLEPIEMTIQLANRSVVQPVGILEDVLVQVNELIFSTEFYVLDMEDETSGKGSSLILGKVSLSIDEVQNQGLGSWKLSKVIAPYSQRTPVDKKLNIWPSMVHHHHPSKAITVEESEIESVRLCRVCLSRNHIGSSSQSPTKIIPVALKPTDSNTHHFDNRGSTTSRGMNGIAAADNQRFEGYIDGCGMCGSIGHPPNDCPILQEPPPPFRPQP
ncbi:hypothetical protein CR513_53058, partial [Mucuna pruriens]